MEISTATRRPSSAPSSLNPLPRDLAVVRGCSNTAAGGFIATKAYHLWSEFCAAERNVRMPRAPFRHEFQQGQLPSSEAFQWMSMARAGGWSSITTIDHDGDDSSAAAPAPLTLIELTAREIRQQASSSLSSAAPAKVHHHRTVPLPCDSALLPPSSIPTAPAPPDNGGSSSSSNHSLESVSASTVQRRVRRNFQVSRAQRTLAALHIVRLLSEPFQQEEIHIDPTAVDPAAPKSAAHHSQVVHALESMLLPSSKPSSAQPSSRKPSGSGGFNKCLQDLFGGGEGLRHHRAPRVQQQQQFSSRMFVRCVLEYEYRLHVLNMARRLLWEEKKTIIISSSSPSSEAVANVAVPPSVAPPAPIGAAPSAAAAAVGSSYGATSCLRGRGSKVDERKRQTKKRVRFHVATDELSCGPPFRHGVLSDLELLAMVSSVREQEKEYPDDVVPSLKHTLVSCLPSAHLPAETQSALLLRYLTGVAACEEAPQQREEEKHRIEKENARPGPAHSTATNLPNLHQSPPSTSNPTPPLPLGDSVPLTEQTEMMKHPQSIDENEVADAFDTADLDDSDEDEEKVAALSAKQHRFVNNPALVYAPPEEPIDRFSAASWGLETPKDSLPNVDCSVIIRQAAASRHHDHDHHEGGAPRGGRSGAEEEDVCVVCELDSHGCLRCRCGNVVHPSCAWRYDAASTYCTAYCCCVCAERWGKRGGGGRKK